MNYIDILNNETVIKEYNKIDKINPYPFNHGLQHVKNVCGIMEKLCNTLNIEEEKKEALLIACALHDIGQADGRDHHGKKAKDFLIKNFEDDLKDNKYYDDILNAIEQHDEPCNDKYSLFTVLVQFCDKIDFSKARLEKDYRERFRYYCYENIDSVEFIYDDNNFGIDIITSNINDFNEQFFKENFCRKIVNALEVLATKLNRDYILLNNGEKMKILISNYIIIHGSFGSNKGNWFPWLKDELEKKNYKVSVPQMPIGVGNQNYDNWSKELDKLNIDDNTILIGHSIAPAFICKYLINKKIKVKKLIFVCGFNNYLGIDPDFDAVNESMFLDNIEDVKKYCDSIICFYSDNDPYVKFEVEKSFADLVSNKQHIIKNGGHINEESGYTKFEEIIDYL